MKIPLVVIGLNLCGAMLTFTGGYFVGRGSAKPVCDHPVIPVWVSYVPTNDLVKIQTNVRRIIEELYDTPTEVAGGFSNLAVTAGTILVTNTYSNGTFTVHFPNREKIKWGGQATNSP